MNNEDILLLKKLGILIIEYEYTYNYNLQKGCGEFTIDEEVFRPMCHLIRLTNMICESKNPAVNKMFHHLVTMLELTKENNG